MADTGITCSHTMQLTMKLRWFPRIVEGSAPHPYETQVLRQAYRCIDCGWMEWADVPTEKV